MISSVEEKHGAVEVKGFSDVDLHPVATNQEGELIENNDHLHRRLNNRQIQLIAIGGSIGTALFVSISSGLMHGGPGSLFLAYALYSVVLALINNGVAEMTTLYPVSGGYVRLAGHFVDEAFGYMAGWNFLLYEALSIPFEITALTTVLGFWSDRIPPWSIPIACIILYGVLNIFAVKAYGEAEFWLSGGKVILIFILFAFTFITMVGGNPEHDAYGFRYWNHPGAFAEYRSTGSLGKFEGFLAALWAASFCIVGPEYVTMVAGEAQRPRIYIKNAFKTMYWRFALFFIGGALAAGTVIAYNDPKLLAIFSGKAAGGGTAAASPYVIAMVNLKINGLPHLVNALLCTSIFSAGNTYTYCGSRTLYGMAIEGRAPAIFRRCTKNGIPIYALGFIMLFPFLSFLQVSSGSAVVLGWFTNIITGGGIMTYIIMSVTYICFYNATKAQGLDRKSLPYCGWFQPYSAWIGLICQVAILLTYGYTSYKPFNVQNWFIYYAMSILGAITFCGFKLVRKTKFVTPTTADLVWERPTIDAYEAALIDPPSTFWREMVDMFRFKKSSKQVDESSSDA